MAILYLMRHGETEWNRRHLFQGSGDSELTEEGKDDLRSIGRRLDGVEFDQVYCSTLGRARKSLDIVGPQSPHPTIYDPRLEEMNLGVLEERRYDRLEAPFDAMYETFLKNPPEFRAEGAETFMDVRDRVYGVISEFDRSAERIFVMAHGVVLKMFLAYLRDRPLEQLWGDPHLYNATLVLGRLDQDGHELLEVIYPDSVTVASRD
jgi:broad specificity phosphatase PhoE